MEDFNGSIKADKINIVKKEKESDIIIALAGNPNVGKSTVFNEVTGMNQHTGNWPGKTVGIAQGKHKYKGKDFIFIDLPGTYSLKAHSAEEEIARDFILFGGSEAVVIVCDATCLERNLNLVLQTMEISNNIILCLNLMDEASKKGIEINIEQLEKILGIPVVTTSARSGKGINNLLKKISSITDRDNSINKLKLQSCLLYPAPIEDAITKLEARLSVILPKQTNIRWIALKILEESHSDLQSIVRYTGVDLFADKELTNIYNEIKENLLTDGISESDVADIVVSTIVEKASDIFKGTVKSERTFLNSRDRKLDKILTSKHTGIPIMLVLLCLVFWITIVGANYPSQMLASGLFWFQDRLTDLFVWANAPSWLHGMLVLGVYRVLAWVVSVMFPPMAIFFPLFTLLEDFGYLPRVAFNLDHHFTKACACGKQALTMCMGFGCNAAGVIGCRIIDSPRERLIAILTNNFVPCNGRFPTLIAIISMFFLGASSGLVNSLGLAVLLTCVIVLGVFLTFKVSKFLSKTILKGEPSSFTLELPPYRAPQIGKVIVRSIFDRTIFVLGRAVVVAAPAGLVIWILANVYVNDISLLNHCVLFLDPFAYLIGLDGIILLAFILGFPANEIVVPIIIMSYLSTGSLIELDSLSELKILLIENEWTWLTAMSTMLLCLIHWPCSTTCLTIKKETGSWKWTGISIAIPTVVGISVCFIFATTVRFLHLV